MVLAFLLFPVLIVCSIASLVCFIMVVVKMFQNDQTGMAIACIVLSFCTGVGPIIAFVVGWMNSATWNLKNVMLIWTGAVGLQVLTGVLLLALGAFEGMMAQPM